MSLGTLCQGNMLCYSNNCAIPFAAQISIPPCSPLTLPHSPKTFLMLLRLVLFLVPAHNAEAEIMTRIAWLHYWKEKKYLFLLLSD